MLSTGAFNALLKTLEEPPDHAKFIFATTEIRKVPVTVLSRCQRFDLRRVDTAELKAHLASICEQEGIAVSDEGLMMIARAAEGSVRDGLSLLDQAMVQAVDGQEVSADQVRDMLGLADRSRVLDLFEAIAAGDAARAMQGVSEQYNDGANPDVLMRDLLDICHEVSRAKTLGDAATFDADSETSNRLKLLSEKLSVGQITRLWQMLLKSQTDVREAPAPATAAEMAVLSLSSAAEMPAPEIAAALIAELKSGNFSFEHLSEKLRKAGVPVGGVAVSPSAPATVARTEPEPAPVMPKTVKSTPVLESFADLLDALDPKLHADLVYDIERFVRPVEFGPGEIAYAKEPGAPADLPARMIRLLKDLTGELWVVSDSAKGGKEPVGVTRKREAEEAEAKLRAHPAFEHPLLRDEADFIEFTDAPSIDVEGSLSEDPDTDTEEDAA